MLTIVIGLMKLPDLAWNFRFINMHHVNIYIYTYHAYIYIIYRDERLSSHGTRIHVCCVYNIIYILNKKTPVFVHLHYVNG